MTSFFFNWFIKFFFYFILSFLSTILLTFFYFCNIELLLCLKTLKIFFIKILFFIYLYFLKKYLFFNLLLYDSFLEYSNKNLKNSIMHNLHYFVLDILSKHKYDFNINLNVIYNQSKDYFLCNKYNTFLFIFLDIIIIILFLYLFYFYYWSICAFLLWKFYSFYKIILFYLF